MVSFSAEKDIIKNSMERWQRLANNMTFALG